MTQLSPPFLCAPQMVFLPKWQKFSFESKAKNTYGPVYYIVLKSAQMVLDTLKAMGREEAVFVIENNASIESIPMKTRGQIKPHFIFISETHWVDGVLNDEVVLFLKLLQFMSSQPEFTLSVVGINALVHPESKEVLNPLDTIYLGLAKTFSKEISHATVNTFHITHLNAANLEKITNYSFESSPLSAIFVSDDGYYTQSLISSIPSSNDRQMGFKTRGHYLIIGGNGGIGRAIAQYLANAYQAKIVIIGRSHPKDVWFANIDNISFEQVDMAQKEEVDAFFKRYPSFDGIIHSALVLDDASILHMKPSQLLSVLAPKVQGSIHLANAIAHKPLDFVLFFSSIQSFIANKGQGNYTAACLCKDAIASVLRDVFMVNAKVINWGYWGSIGIVAQDFYREKMRQQEIGSIEIEEGLNIIEQFLKSDELQIAVVKGSEKALLNMGLTLANELAKQNILPSFDKNHAVILRNKDAMDALESYTRYQWSRCPKPQTILPQYQRLWAAVNQIHAPMSYSEDILSAFPEISGHVQLLDTCLKHFAAIVSGEQNALSVLFPEGSFHLVEGVYRNNSIADYYNAQMLDVLMNVIREQHKPQKTIHILEIGAGTGSTSRVVIPKLAGLNVRYVYTDLSQAFLNKARQTFAAYDFIEYEIFNVELPYKKEHLFDIVLATNVIHATKDIQNTLRNIHQLMQPNGVFILNEITARQDFATLTFGLTEGWWLNQDEFRIPNSPLLSLDAWQTALHQTQFSDIESHGDFGQHVIVAGAQKEEINVSSIPLLSQNVALLQNNKAKEWIAHLIKDILFIPIDEIEDDVPFTALGIDSLIVFELIKPMSEKLGYIPATIFFEYPTLNQLADFFSKEFPTHFEPSEPTTVIQYKTQDNTQDIIKEIIAQTMHIPMNELDEHTPFHDFGIDSLISLEILKPLQAAFGYLPATLIFEYPTIAQLTGYLRTLQTKTVGDIELKNNRYPEQREEIPNHSEAPFPHNDVEPLNNAVAIVGMAGRFPNADTLDDLWAMLSSSKDAFKLVDDERWSKEYVKKSYTQKGAFIQDIDAFDHAFFKITPIDAERMDPQERLFLQTTYHAIQDAGFNLDKLSGQDVGCYVGVMNHGYSWLSLSDQSNDPPSSLFWSIANRVSYQFNWRGPSFAIDSACSSSLTALHTAVMAIQNGDCSIAVVGGVNLIVHPRQYDVLCQLHMLSRCEKCQPFGKNADGFVDGEGVISVVLKPLQAALKEGCRIYGVIRGTSVNSGGKGNGYTAPNAKAQSLLIEKAFERAHLKPSDIHYVEAHGTGTELGDPIEIQGLSMAFQGVEKGSIPIGSIKGNLGHLESAAGLVALVKVLLQIKHQKLVPSIHCEEENPHLRLTETPFYVNRALSDWRSSSTRFAAISSFGAGGANAHVIIASHPLPKTSQNVFKHYFFPLSAHSAHALQHEVNALLDLLEKDTQSLEQLSYGYCAIRSVFTHRFGLVVQKRHELKEALQAYGFSQHTQSAKDGFVHKDIINTYVQGGKEDDTLAAQIMQQFNAGASLDFTKLFAAPIAVTLPLYPFDKHRHWVKAIESQFHLKQSIIGQHQILGEAMAPAALVFSMLYEQTRANFFQNVMWKNIIHQLENVAIQVDNDAFSVTDKENRVLFSEGTCRIVPLADVPKETQWIAEHTLRMSRQEIYQRFKELGYVYGSYYQAILQAYISPQQVHSVIEITKDWGYALSPVLIDAALQTAILMQQGVSKEVYVPFFVESLTIHALPKKLEPIYCICHIASTSPQSTTYDIKLKDKQGTLLIMMKGIVSLKTNVNKLLDSVARKPSEIKVFELN